MVYNLIPNSTRADIGWRGRRTHQLLRRVYGGRKTYLQTQTVFRKLTTKSVTKAKLHGFSGKALEGVEAHIHFHLPPRIYRRGQATGQNFFASTEGLSEDVEAPTCEV